MRIVWGLVALSWYIILNDLPLYAWEFIQYAGAFSIFVGGVYIAHHIYNLEEDVAKLIMLYRTQENNNKDTYDG